MRLREKGKKDGDTITLGWDEAQAALQAGTHEAVNETNAAAGDGTAAQDDGLDDKTRDELNALAKERGVDVSQAKTKDDVIAALRAKK